MPRKTKYTKAKGAEFCQAIGLGLTRSAAAAQVGVGLTSVYRWAKNNGAFARLVKEAEDQAEGLFTRVVMKAALGHPEVTERVKSWTVPIVIKDKDGNEHIENQLRTETIRTEKTVYDWKAAQFWLERRRPDQWAERIHLDLEQEIEGLLARIMAMPGTDTDDIIEILAEGYKISDEPAPQLTEPIDAQVVPNGKATNGANGTGTKGNGHDPDESADQ